MATDLTAHQTKGARDIAWLYGGGSRSGGGRSSGGSGGGGKSGKKRPDWIENPPEGFIVGRGQSQTMSMAQSKARSDAERLLLKQHGVDSANTSGLSTAKNFRDPETGEWYTLFDTRNVTVTPLPAEAAPERPQEPVADAPLALDDYEQPTLDPVDLDLELGEEEEEEEEELAVEPAIREPALDYALDEEDEEEAPSLEDQIVETTRFRESPDISIAGSTPAVNPMEQFRDVYGFGFEDATAPRFPVSPDISITGSTPAPDATQLMRRSAEAGGAATPPATTAVDISAAGGVPALMNEEDRERRFAEIQGDRIEEAPQFDVGRDISITGSEDMAKLPEDAGPGLLDRLAGMGGKIGQLVRDNPDLVLQGLRTIGELGGEYKRGRREQEAADRMAEEARMGTAISALTRGRVNPTVTPRMPRTSAGEGMFDVLAGIGRGGQEFMSQKRALEDQERLEGMQDEEIERTRRLEDEAIEREIEATAYQKEQDLRAQGLEEKAIQREVDRFKQELMLRAYEAKTDRMRAVAEGLPDGADTGDLDPTKLAQIDQVLTRLEEHVEDPKFGTTGLLTGLGPSGGAGAIQAAADWIPGSQGWDAVKNQEYFKVQTADIVFRVLKPLSKEGRLSMTDYDNLERMAGRPDMSTDLQRQLLQDIRASIAEAAKTAPGTHKKWSDEGEGGASQSSANEEDLLALADRAYDDEGNIVDREAYAELQRLDSKTP
jgi:hypothetical protein